MKQKLNGQVLKELLHTLSVEIRDKRQLAGELCLNTRQLDLMASPLFSKEKTNLDLLQYSCLENPRDRRAWRAAVYGVTQCQT